uniref:Vesicle-fusing ATPase n=1 Tax=Eucampia antarctica TaxID=49252 RepID=A0A7S2WKD9_9STRA
MLDRWVGGSEKLIRELFQDAEDELRVNGGDATQSSLHVIVIDEIDAVFRKRTASEDSGQVSRASAVNQILTKLDGINAIPNVLLIGMTNRRELLDEALLRPGRLEVQILIPKPNQHGRRQILNIHFNALRKRGRLSQPLCQAIDGTNKQLATTTTTTKTTSTGKRTKPLRSILSNVLRRSSTVIPNYHRNTIVDLTDTIWTGGFTGADIAGLVRCAGSIALARAREQGMGTDALLITLEDVHAALAEVKRNNVT